MSCRDTVTSISTDIESTERNISKTIQDRRWVSETTAETLMGTGRIIRTIPVLEVTTIYQPRREIVGLEATQILLLKLTLN